MATKLSEAALLKLLGKITPLPGGPGQVSPQMQVPSATPAPAAVPNPVAPPMTPPAGAQPPSGRYGVGALPANPVMNPGAITRAQLADAEQGMKKGGKVKKMASGGAVRGTGCAIKGIKKWTVR